MELEMKRMDKVLTEEEERYSQVRTLSVRLYGLHAAAKSLDMTSQLTPSRRQLVESAHGELYAVLQGLGAEFAKQPTPLGEMELWVLYRGITVPRDGEVILMDRWVAHLINPLALSFE